jgi:riboflavin kinase/FMN adenylyltransferase
MKILDDTRQTAFSGEVIPGRQIGRTLGFPTANLRVSNKEEWKLPLGVYGVKVHYKGVLYNGVMNIGRRPTFKGEEPKLSIEVYILQFNEDIYGEQLWIKVLFFLRHELAFNSIEQLRQQIKEDINTANRQFLLRE